MSGPQITFRPIASKQLKSLCDCPMLSYEQNSQANRFIFYWCQGGKKLKTDNSYLVQGVGYNSY